MKSLLPVVLLLLIISCGLSQQELFDQQFDKMITDIKSADATGDEEKTLTSMRKYETLTAVPFFGKNHKDRYYAVLSNSDMLTALNAINKYERNGRFEVLVNDSRALKKKFPESAYNTVLKERIVRVLAVREKNACKTLLAKVKYDQAFPLYESFKNNYPKSKYLTQIERHLMELNIKKLDELSR